MQAAAPTDPPAEKKWPVSFNLPMTYCIDMHFTSHASINSKSTVLHACMCQRPPLAEVASLLDPQGAKPVPLAAAVGLGMLLRFAVPIPEGITVQAWTLLSIFVSAIVGEDLRLPSAALQSV